MQKVFNIIKNCAKAYESHNRTTIPVSLGFVETEAEAKKIVDNLTTTYETVKNMAKTIKDLKRTFKNRFTPEPISKLPYPNFGTEEEKERNIEQNRKINQMNKDAFLEYQQKEREYLLIVFNADSLDMYEKVANGDKVLPKLNDKTPYEYQVVERYIPEN